MSKATPSVTLPLLSPVALVRSAPAGRGWYNAAKGCYQPVVLSDLGEDLSDIYDWLTKWLRGWNDCVEAAFRKYQAAVHDAWGDLENAELEANRTRARTLDGAKDTLMADEKQNGPNEAANNAYEVVRKTADLMFEMEMFGPRADHRKAIARAEAQLLRDLLDCYL